MQREIEMIKQHGVPEFRPITPADLRTALHRGWRDLRRVPALSLFFASIYVLFGWLMVYVARSTGQVYWLVLLIAGFPIIGPFAAVGLYETSRRIEAGEEVAWADIFAVIFKQRSGQLPSMSAIIIFILLVWFFLGHMIFALFLGLSPMRNISSSFEVYLTPEGLTMLAVGTVVGALFSLLVYMITVLGVPMLLDRDVDFMSAMIASFVFVQENFVLMILWAALIASLTMIALLTGFLGLFIVLPLFGHGAWHLYSLVKEN